MATAQTDTPVVLSGYTTPQLLQGVGGNNDPPQDGNNDPPQDLGQQDPPPDDIQGQSNPPKDDEQQTSSSSSESELEDADEKKESRGRGRFPKEDLSSPYVPFGSKSEYSDRTKKHSLAKKSGIPRNRREREELRQRRMASTSVELARLVERFHVSKKDKEPDDESEEEVEPKKKSRKHKKHIQVSCQMMPGASPPSFSGEPDEDVLTFIDQLTLWGRQYGWSEQDLIYHLRYSLTGKASVARDWITTKILKNSREGEPLSLETVTEKLRKMYPSKRLTMREDEVLERLFTIRQGLEEKVENFAARFEILVNLRDHDIPDSLASSLFVRGLRTEIRVKVQHKDFENFSKAVKTAVRVEEALERNADVQAKHRSRGLSSSGEKKKKFDWRGNSSTGTSAESRPIKTSQIGDSARKTKTKVPREDNNRNNYSKDKSEEKRESFTGKCFKCKERGHMKRDCPLLKKGKD